MRACSGDELCGVEREVDLAHDAVAANAAARLEAG